jgi:dienelactone hydrolase
VGGCGGGGSTGATVNNSTTPGTLIQNPPLRVASANLAALTANFNATTSGQQLLAIAGTPVCGIDYHYIQYATVGGAGETTTATGVMMVPTGSAAPCTGPRPIVLYAHGTTTVKSYNLAAITDTTNDAYSESALIAAMFAAQGYIVVAPNYAGYDASPLKYHPYLNADQQSKEMIDALTASRSALGHIFASGTTDNGKLFITGYSQGGHVAMATQRALQTLGKTVTAVAPMSGPYALAAFGDAIFFGKVNLGSTEFTPLLTASYKNSYPNLNLYATTTDIFASPYATGIDTLVPGLSFGALLTSGKLPQTALFSSVAPTNTGNATLDSIYASITPDASSPLFSLGFAPSNFLVTNSYRTEYLLDALAHPDGVAVPAASPANALRTAFGINDLRGFTPASPTLLCAGSQDPTVFYDANTGLMGNLWSGLVTAHLVTVLDLETAPTAGDPFATAEGGFAQAKALTRAAAVQAGATDGGAQAVTVAYHGTLVPPFCTAAARGFFSQF